MNHPDQNAPINDAVSDAAEATLRLIATLPPPAGLEDRVHAGLRAGISAPAMRSARVLSWPATTRTTNAWMRGAAAAAIAFVVVGGGSGIYSHVQAPQAARVIAMPHVPAPGEFTNAGAMRTPKTLDGPLVAHPAAALPVIAKAPAKGIAKPMPPQVKKPVLAIKANPQAAIQQAK
jgi:hypothetical protein